MKNDENPGFFIVFFFDFLEDLHWFHSNFVDFSRISLRNHEGLIWTARPPARP